MKEINFRTLTMPVFDKTFGMREIEQDDTLTVWLSEADDQAITDFEEQMLRRLQKHLVRHIDDRNEAELKTKFIGSMMALVDFDDSGIFKYFVERELDSTLGDIRLLGRIDAMVASGERLPERPFFCMSEYKKGKDYSGDPTAQAPGAMPAARTLNDDGRAVYGSYTICRNWFFMTLKGGSYAISNAYVTTKPELFDIFRILKALKSLLLKLGS